MNEEPQQPQPLDYRPQDKADPDRIFGQAIGWAILTAAGLVGLVFVDIYAAFAVSYGRQENNWIAWCMTISLAAATLLLIVLLSIRWYRIPSLRGRALGMWIGVGLAALIQGTCFIFNSR